MHREGQRHGSALTRRPRQRGQRQYSSGDRHVCDLGTRGKSSSDGKAVGLDFNLREGKASRDQVGIQLAPAGNRPQREGVAAPKACHLRPDQLAGERPPDLLLQRPERPTQRRLYLFTEIDGLSGSEFKLGSCVPAYLDGSGYHRAPGRIDVERDIHDRVERALELSSAQAEKCSQGAV